jgi:hypothetical protein
VYTNKKSEVKHASDRIIASQKTIATTNGSHIKRNIKQQAKTMQLLITLLIISHLFTFSSASFGTLRGANEHVALKDNGEAADDNEVS